MLTKTQAEEISKRVFYEHLYDLSLESELRRQLSKRGDYPEREYQELARATKELIGNTLTFLMFK